MQFTVTAQAHPQDPFARYGPQSVRCQWLTQQDEERAKSAEIIRLIVDERRGHTEAWANDAYQRRFLMEVQDFVGPTKAVLVTDAGSIKACIQPLSATLDSLRSGLASLEEALSRVELGRMEILLGVDGCLAGQATHLQTVIHLRSRAEISLWNTTIKLNPAGAESGSLIGWRLCTFERCVPNELAFARCVETSVAKVLVLVCNDAGIFSARSRKNLRDTLKLSIRQHFLDQANTEPKPAYILFATHWNSPRSGEAFRQAAAYLNERTGATVVTTTRASEQELALVATRFKTIGPRKDRVSTLLVRDTLPPPLL